MPAAEWLQPDGLGGFASGTVDGVRTRRYHALLLAAQTPPTARVTLVNGIEVWVEAGGDRFALSSQRYAPDVIHPDGASRLVAFTDVPWPTWRFRLGDGTEIEQRLLCARGAPVTLLTWRIPGAGGPLTLRARPLISGRDIHSTHHENAAFRFDARIAGDRVAWHPYDPLPVILARSNGRYAHEPVWYRDFVYAEERARGLDDTEDLASPGTFEWDLGAGEAVLLLGAGVDGADPLAGDSAVQITERLRRDALDREEGYASALHRAADAYLVRRGTGRTIIAGYPWFSDWGRDTFIAVRGLCLAAGRLDVAREILVAWSGVVSEGMLPNLFPEGGSAPEYNSVDASLWYVVAVHELLAADPSGDIVRSGERRRLRDAVVAIVEGYRRGTRHGIRGDDDGLLASGAPGVQLTWMDAKIGDWVVTPRTGKPVEVQALWLNALRIGAGLAGNGEWAALHAAGERAFADRFWNEHRGCLYDVVDVDHVRGTADPTLRPNQVLAVGGLPFPLLGGERARRVIDTVERELWTPLGLRTLARNEPGYAATYEGGPHARDAVYHQGTVWPWLLGPFVEGWLAVRGWTDDARAEARWRFLAPLEAHLGEAGLGHVSEIADAEPPHVPRGAPFQAWSVGEALRVTALLRRTHAPVPAIVPGEETVAAGR